MRYRSRIPLLLFFWLLFLCSPALASADLSSMAKITGVEVREEQTGLEIIVNADRPITFHQSALSQPPCILVDIPNAWLPSGATKTASIDSPFASKYRMAQFNATTVRIVVETDAQRDQYEATAIPASLGQGGVVIRFGGQKRPDFSKHPAIKETDDSENRPFRQDVKGLRITLDAGHGGTDPGAVGPTGVTEKSVTLRIATELKDMLEKDGAIVYMTRTQDTEVSPKGADATDVEELQARCDVANRSQSDLFVSIHIDAFTRPNPHGTTTFYYRLGSQNSKRFAERIGEEVVRRLQTENRGARSCDFYVVRNTDMTASLIEVAFISNPEEEKLMASEEGVHFAALGLADGIRKFLQEHPAANDSL